MNKYERKGLSEVVLVYQGYEESEFWQLLGGMPDKVRPTELKQFRGPRSPRLYKGTGYQIIFYLPKMVSISTDGIFSEQPKRR